GGAGGSGGAGGGGAGGLSGGIVWSGTAPTIDGAIVMSQATLSRVTLGVSGPGGSGGGGKTAGKDGMAAAVIALP
ncbi:MAG TPA: hypothetical protein VKU41_12350, partial [Polyangiaceae bacterium]|nr:hypothetical protein [Polyangiaceae bacterium]